MSNQHQYTNITNLLGMPDRNGIEYGVEQAETGSHRWFVTRNGQRINAHRQERSARLERYSLDQTLLILGHESALIELYLSREATR